jgi:V8-like Glu-specific endopeptidase
MEDIFNEVIIDLYPKPVTIEGTKKILHQMETSICKIHKKNGQKGTGFFVEISYDKIIIPVMITNYHILDEDYLKKNEEIKISLNDDTIIKTIKLNEKRRIYSNRKFDTTIIEIKPEKDNITDFMELDDNIFKEDSNILYNRQSIYIIHYEKGEKAKVSYAIMENGKEEYNIVHFCCTENGSSGSPIINLLNNKIIGIHKQGSSKLQKNFGTYLKFPINEYINKQLKHDKIIDDDLLIGKKTISKKENKKTEDNNKKEKNIIKENVSHIFILGFIIIFKTLLLIYNIL